MFARLWRACVQSKKLRLDISVSDDMPSLLYGDPQRLNQVLVNLMNNAVKFTEQGSIQVRLYLVDPEHWAIEVSDTGPGIPPEAQRYIFEPFRQVDMEVTRRPGGIGLGLTDRKTPGQTDAGRNLSEKPGGGGKHLYRDPAVKS